MTAAEAAAEYPLLWHSNAPWAPTGYGAQTALFAPRLSEHYRLTLSSNYGLEAAPIVWRGIPVLPGLGGDHGSATVPGHAIAAFEEPRDGLVVTLYDPPALDPDVFSRFNVLCWTPVDHEPATAGLISFFRNSGAIPMAMSRFGEAELKEFEPLYCPHGVDISVYHPEAGSIREEMEIAPDAFLVSMVAANKGRPSRKCFQQALDAFMIFQEQHRDAYLYIHTTVSPEFAGGEDIMALAAALGIHDRILIPPQYNMIFHPHSHEAMARVYASSDVLLNPSMGEGFGVPILEAAACGTPSIVTDHSAMPEVAGPAGWVIPGRPYWTGQSSWMSVPDVPKIVEALRAAAAESPDARRSRSLQARSHAHLYDADLVLEKHMLPSLEEARKRIGDRAPVKVAAKGS